MYFLGQASNYKFADILRHTFAFGTKNDLSELRAFLAAHYGTTKDRVALYHTGRTALATAISRLVPPESEVIITSLTCYAVYEAVSEAGCFPVFADVDKDTMHFGPEELEATLTLYPNARAVIVQNNLGIPCDIEAIKRICKKRGLFLIEDLAHCVGARYKNGREAGTVGDAAVLSFGKGKSIDTISGGAVVFTNPKSATIHQPSRRPPLSDSLRDRFYPLFGAEIRGLYHFGNLGRYFTSLLLKLHFIERSADASLESRERITYWQAKLALSKLKRLPRSGRKPLREFYYVNHRKELLNRLESAGYIFDDIWYNCPVSPVRYYHRTNFPEEECPVSVWAARHVINVPTWYSKKELKPALKLIENYLVSEDEIPSGVEFIPDDEEEYEEYEEEYEEPTIETAEEPLEETRHIEKDGGTINYSELVYDKFDRTHLNRTNIIDKDVNSDGTTVSLTKEERKPKKQPLKNNLPKIRQYKKPERGPETTEGKVW